MNAGYGNDEFDMNAGYDLGTPAAPVATGYGPPPDDVRPEARRSLASRLSPRALKVLGIVAVVAALAVAAFMLLGVGTPGSKILKEYSSISSNPKKQLLVLQHVADGDMPGTWNDWVTIKVTSKTKKDLEAEFYVSPHGLRLGNSNDWVEIPLDGPHSAAVAEILDVKLATSWMVKKIHEQVTKKDGDGKAVEFFDSAEVAESLGIEDWNPNRPDGEKMQSPEFVAGHNALLHAWLEENSISGDTLISGYFKTVVQPVAGITTKKAGRLAIVGIGKAKTNRLEIVGGYDAKGHIIQGLSGGVHWEIYFDHTHNVRMVKDEVKVGDKTMTLNEFFSSATYAQAFVFRASGIPDRAYPYSPVLARWMRKGGYLRYPLTEKEREKMEKEEKEEDEE